jgi:hypothetical protein
MRASTGGRHRDGACRGVQSQQDADERRLAGAGLADDADGGALEDVDVGVVERSSIAPARTVRPRWRKRRLSARR